MAKPKNWRRDPEWARSRKDWIKRQKLTANGDRAPWPHAALADRGFQTRVTEAQFVAERHRVRDARVSN